MKRRIASLEDMRTFAREIAHQPSDRFLLLLDGPMGVGKTQFTKFFLEELGSHETVSPSYAIHNKYVTKTREIEHFDLYRLENADDLESTGFWDLFDSNAWVIIEWSERLNEFSLKSALPKTWPQKVITFSFEENSEARLVEVKS